MGKGGGCVPSKSSSKKTTNKYASDSTAAATTTTPTVDPPHVEPKAIAPTHSTPTETHSTPIQTPPPPPPVKNLKLFIIYYSMYGHVESLAKKMKVAVDGVDGVEAVLLRVPETLPEDVLAKMRAPPKDDSIPEITSAADITEADGFLFGFPTRYGTMAAQMKAFFDSTGQLWQQQALAGKPAGFFVSTGTQGGGQETTAWTAITQLAHHGMLFVPIGYTFGAGMFKMEEIRGGTPYGAGVYAGDGTREATETELAIAEHQGTYMASIVKKLC